MTAVELLLRPAELAFLVVVVEVSEVWAFRHPCMVDIPRLVVELRNFVDAVAASLQIAWARRYMARQP